MWHYENEETALVNVLRLSKGMTYKAAIAGLNLGGEKAVIIGDSKTQKNRKPVSFIWKIRGGLRRQIYYC